MKTYTIKKGTHYSGNFIQRLLRARLHFKKTVYQVDVMFTPDCIYLPINRDYKDDLNKLGGFSFWFHHIDSARFAWKPELDERNIPTGRIEIYSYIYSGGYLSYNLLCSIRVNETHTINIIKTKYNDGEIIYNFNVFHDRFPLAGRGFKHKKPKYNFGYILWPFFGGNETAQHDTNIFMTKPLLQ